jgi:hypothetical protein
LLGIGLDLTEPLIVEISFVVFIYVLGNTAGGVSIGAESTEFTNLISVSLTKYTWFSSISTLVGWCLGKTSPTRSADGAGKSALDVCTTFLRRGIEFSHLSHLGWLGLVPSSDGTMSSCHMVEVRVVWSIVYIFRVSIVMRDTGYVLSSRGLEILWAEIGPDCSSFE